MSSPTLLQELRAHVQQAGQLFREPVDANPDLVEYEENLKAWRKVERDVEALSKYAAGESVEGIAEKIETIKHMIGRYGVYGSWCHKLLSEAVTILRDLEAT
ncbi:MAG: hypothetical protein KDB61_00885 [Planctomycetes bacterium]|nr:hypothetical protein [Planctomycetota bacterium]